MKSHRKAKFKVSRKHNAFWTLFYEYGVLLVTIIKGLVLVPIYLKYIDTNLYGYWLAMASVTIWLSAVDPGFSDIVIQQTAKVLGKKEYSRIFPVAIASIMLGVLFACCMGIGGFFISGHIGSLLGIKDLLVADTIIDVFRMALAGNILLLISFSFTAVSQGLQQGRGCGIISLFANILSVIVVYMTLINGQGVYALAWGPLVFGGVLMIGQGCYAVWNLKATGAPFTFLTSEFSRLWKLSWINFFGKTSRVISGSIDNFLLARMLGPEQVVIFEMTRRGPKFSGTFLGRIGNAVSAAIAHLHGDGHKERLRYWGVKILQIVLWLLAIFAGCFMALNREFIQLWIGSQFYAGVVNSDLIILWISSLIIMNLLNILLLSTGAIGQSSKVNVAYIVLLVPTLIAGIYFAGIRGLAVGGLFSTLIVLLFMQWPLYQKAFDLRKQERLLLLREAVKAIFPVAVAVIVSAFFPAATWLLFIVKAAGCAGLIIVTLAICSQTFRSSLLKIVANRNFLKQVVNP